MNRTEKSIRMKLWFLDLIGEDDVTWVDKIHQEDNDETEEEQTNKVDRRRKTKTEISV